MTPDEIIKDSIIAAAEGVKIPKPAFSLNSFNRIRKKVRAQRTKRFFQKIARAKRELRVLRVSGVAPSHKLVATTRAALSPIPAALKGQVKQAGRSLDRFQNAQAAAKKARPGILAADMRICEYDEASPFHRAYGFEVTQQDLDAAKAIIEKETR